MFEDIKKEILQRAKDASACAEQYKRALNADNIVELATVIKDNYAWCCNNRVLTPYIICKFKTEFAEVDIFANESKSSGYVLIDGHVDCLSGTAIAFMHDNAAVNVMHDNATVIRMHDNAAVNVMHDNATVIRMHDNAAVNVMHDNAAVNVMHDNATVIRMHDNAAVNVMHDNATVIRMHDNATVIRMHDNTYISTFSYFECKIHDNAIMRVRGANKILSQKKTTKPNNNEP